MYEYFCSERCSTLTGHEGAYNKFEDELRQNIIIIKLNQIETRMDDIQRNQHILWEAINETSMRVDSLSFNVDNSIKNMTAEIESAKYKADRAIETGDKIMNYLTWRT